MDTRPKRLAKYLLFIATVTLAMGFPMFVFYAIGVLGPTLISEFSIDESMLGVLTLSMFGFAALLSLGAGQIVNALGAKKGLGLLFILVFFSFLLLVMFNSFYGIVIALLFCGMAQALANPVTNLMIAQQVEHRFKATVIGIKQSGIQFSALLAGLMLPFFIAYGGWQLLFIILLPIVFLLAIFAPKIAIERNIDVLRQPLRLKIEKPNRLLALLMVTQLGVGMVIASYITYIGLFADSLGASHATIGYLISLFGVMGIVSRILMTIISAKIKDDVLLLSLLILIAMLVLTLLFWTTENRHWPLWLSAFGLGATIVACNAIAMSIILRDVRFGQTAVSSGLLSSGFFAGFAFGPSLFGLLQGTYFGFYAGWSALIGLLLLSFILSLILFKLRK